MPKRRLRTPDATGAPARPKRGAHVAGGETVPAARAAVAATAAAVAGLQRLAGNHAVARLLETGGPPAAALPAAPAALRHTVQRRHHRHGGGGGGQGPVAQPQPATMRVQVQSKRPRYDDGIGLTEAGAGTGVTTAQVQAALTTLIARFPSRDGRAALTDTAAAVMADLAGRVNPAGELGRNNSTSWRVDHPDYTGFRIDVENIRGRNLYA